MKKQKTSSGGSIDLDMREVGSELIAGGIEELEQAKENLCFYMQKKQPKDNLLIFKSSLDIY